MPALQSRASYLGKAIAIATLVAGSLDIADALIFYSLRGVPPTRLLQSIAAASLLGRAAFNGGTHTALLGLVVHFCITATVATVYLVASRSLPLFRHPLVYGALYGVAVYCIMNYIVMPLDKTPPKVLIQPLVPLANGVAALVVCIGIPIALIAARYVAPPVYASH